MRAPVTDIEFLTEEEAKLVDHIVERVLGQDNISKLNRMSKQTRGIYCKYVQQLIDEAIKEVLNTAEFGRDEELLIEAYVIARDKVEEVANE